MAVVTISRQYGAGGRRVGPAIAQALGFRFVDREIAEEAARRMGVDPETVQGWDERAPAIVEELGLALAAAAPGFGIPHVPDLDDRALAEATRRVIVSLADAGSYVILGRGAQAALSDRDDVIHLSLVGEPEDRARQVMQSQGCDRKEALALCERVDGERAGYVRRFYWRDIKDVLLYDCVLNTSRLSLDDAVAVSVDAARRKLGLG